MDVAVKKVPDSVVREAVAVFNSVEDLREAMTDLQQNGFMRQELGFLADERTVEEKLGYYRKTDDVKHHPDAPRALFMPDEPVGEVEAALAGIPLYIAAVTASGVVIASGGALLTAVAAAVAAGGGAAALGAILSRFVANHHAEYLQTQIEKGGLVLWVHIRSPERERMARQILDKHGAKYIETHEVSIKED